MTRSAPARRVGSVEELQVLDGQGISEPLPVGIEHIDVAALDAGDAARRDVDPGDAVPCRGERQ